MMAYREISYGTWSNGGMGCIRMDAADPKPVSKPTPPTDTPPVPELKLLKRKTYLYAVGDYLVLQDPPTLKRQKVAVKVEGRYRLVRGKRRGLEFLYAMTIDGEQYMMTEAAIASAMKRKPVIHTLPKPNASEAITA